MRNELVTAFRAAAVTLVLTGIAYPLLVTGIAQVAFPAQANGSLINDTTEPSVTMGSALIGQSFSDPAYVNPRPSAAGAGYDAAASSGSNLGPTSKALRDRVAADVARLVAANPNAPGEVPAELVTASGSGLDPHLSPASVAWQIPRIAAARGVAADRVRAVAAEFEQGRALGVLGEPRVNVLLLNLALDRRFGQPHLGASITPK
ncbi:MAG: potassium-transporting ATPase subunit KdpC [Planctomycetes bacterium]|nr:potassium-transporting ATPase subunit KdpC [Planctomycetota bacterium]